MKNLIFFLVFCVAASAQVPSVKRTPLTTNAPGANLPEQRTYLGIPEGITNTTKAARHSALVGPTMPRTSLGAKTRYITDKVIRAGYFADGATNKWTGISTTIGQDSTNVLSSTNTSPTGLLVTGGFSTGQAVRYDLGGAVDLTNKIVLLRWYRHPGSGTSDPTNYVGTARGTRFYLSDSTTTPPGGNCFESSLFDADIPVAPSDDTVEGWFQEAIPVSSLTKYNSGDISSVRYLWVYFMKVTGTSPASTLDCAAIFSSPHAAGMYTIRLDLPASSTWSDMLPIATYAQQLGIKLTCGISPWAYTSLGSAYSSYITIPQIRLLQEMGHEICIYAGNVNQIDMNGDGVDDALEQNWINKTRAMKVAQAEYAHKWWAENDIAGVGPEIIFISGGSGYLYYDRTYLRPKYWSVVSPLKSWPSVVEDSSIVAGSYFIDATADALMPAALTTMIANAQSDKTVVNLGSHIATANQRGQLCRAMDALAASTLVNKTYSQIYTGK